LFGWIGSAYSIRAALIAAGLTLAPVLPIYGSTLGKKIPPEPFHANDEA
jgi:hypothetical protein